MNHLLKAKALTERFEDLARSLAAYTLNPHASKPMLAELAKELLAIYEERSAVLKLMRGQPHD